MKLITDLSKDEVITLVNKDFKVKVNGRNYVGPSISKLVGFEGLSEILEDEELAVKICREALLCPDDVFTRKLRRGLTLRFYVK